MGIRYRIIHREEHELCKKIIAVLSPIPCALTAKEECKRRKLPKLITIICSLHYNKYKIPNNQE
jgi:hypothetical protein